MSTTLIEKHGRWFVGDRRVAVYVDKRLPEGKRQDAANALVRADAAARRKAKAAKAARHALREDKV